MGQYKHKYLWNECYSENRQQQEPVIRQPNQKASWPASISVKPGTVLKFAELVRNVTLADFKQYQIKWVYVKVTSADLQVWDLS